MDRACWSQEQEDKCAISDANGPRNMYSRMPIRGFLALVIPHGASGMFKEGKPD